MKILIGILAGGTLARFGSGKALAHLALGQRRIGLWPASLAPALLADLA